MLKIRINVKKNCGISKVCLFLLRQNEGWVDAGVTTVVPLESESSPHTHICFGQLLIIAGKMAEWFNAPAWCRFGSPIVGSNPALLTFLLNALICFLC